MQIASVTMVYNEPEYLPIWLRYYSHQLGAENCFVIDHGSTDGSIEQAKPKNIVRLPRSPQDEERRIRTISDYCNFLLHHFDYVIYTDVDEILVADPRQFIGISDFCEKVKPRIATAIGLNVHHDVDAESTLDQTRAILLQRSWVRFVSPMCKPLISSLPVKWGRGFHSSNYPTQYENVFLFHLRYVDLKLGLDRLGRTRSLARQTAADERAAAHQRLEDSQFEAMMRGIAGLPKIEPASFAKDEPPLSHWISKSMEGESGRVKMDVFANELWKVPEYFGLVF